jgi:hypothetical protein
MVLQIAVWSILCIRIHKVGNDRSRKDQDRYDIRLIEAADAWIADEEVPTIVMTVFTA